MTAQHSTSGLFSRLDETERTALQRLLQPRKFRAGETVFRAGDPAGSLFVVQSGHLHVVLETITGERLTVAEFGAGEILGEVSFFDGQPRLATAEVIEDAELLECSYPILLEFIKQHPHAAWDMMGVMGQRLRRVDELLQRRAARGEPPPGTEEALTLSERLADQVVGFGGSWSFLFAFLATLVAWILVNTLLLLQRPFDPYPFILLNLALSVVAAIQAPIILMSQNRQSAVDRRRAELNYQVNLKTEVEIAELHRKVNALQQQLANGRRSAE